MEVTEGDCTEHCEQIINLNKITLATASAKGAKKE